MDQPVIGTLLDSFGAFGQFNLGAYYVTCFGALPSSLKVSLPSEKPRDAVDSIMQMIDLQKNSFEPVTKDWRVDEIKKPEQDLFDEYAYELLFKSNSRRTAIQIMCHHHSLEITFAYDIKDQDTEAWILETSRQLQGTFKTTDKPKFKVLIAQDGMFNTEEVETSDFISIDIKELYNDDFVEVDTLINASIQKKESGMILLHGEPGTGKTTYIKHLISKFKEKKFIFIQNDFVKELLKPSFVAFLLQNKDALLIIEDAEKVVVARDSSTDESVVSTLLQLTDGLFSDFLNIKIICTFNTNLERIDKALLRKGRMIAKYNFTPLSAEKTAALAKKLGHEGVTGSLTLADIFGYDHQSFSKSTKRTIGFT
ncbi:MAG: AAA family ATPase [Anaerolineales bacterium]|nr:AAA family ATPase [Anaerolineales bacterium]